MYVQWKVGENHMLKNYTRHSHIYSVPLNLFVQVSAIFFSISIGSVILLISNLLLSLSTFFSYSFISYSYSFPFIGFHVKPIYYEDWKEKENIHTHTPQVKRIKGIKLFVQPTHLKQYSIFFNYYFLMFIYFLK